MAFHVISGTQVELDFQTMEVEHIYGYLYKKFRTMVINYIKNIYEEGGSMLHRYRKININTKLFKLNGGQWTPIGSRI